ncbi:unnamed protein product, partial [Rotaria magnacalcarata]
MQREASKCQSNGRVTYTKSAQISQFQWYRIVDY